MAHAHVRNRRHNNGVSESSERRPLPKRRSSRTHFSTQPIMAEDSEQRHRVSAGSLPMPLNTMRTWRSSIMEGPKGRQRDSTSVSYCMEGIPRSVHVIKKRSNLHMQYVAHQLQHLEFNSSCPPLSPTFVCNPYQPDRVDGIILVLRQTNQSLTKTSMILCHRIPKGTIPPNARSPKDAFANRTTTKNMSLVQ